jgi:hypothetical protein
VAVRCGTHLGFAGDETLHREACGMDAPVLIIFIIAILIVAAIALRAFRK